jgi:hypothetical protein
MRTAKHLTEDASTLIEASVAAAICALFLGSLFTLNTKAMSTLKSAREAACASQVLQQRIEALRIANWHQVTDADWLTANILNADASGASGLKSASETLTLEPYGSANTATTQISRSSGQANIVTRNSNLLSEFAVKVTWVVNYTGTPNDRPMTRQTVAILGKGGVAR